MNGMFNPIMFYSMTLLMVLFAVLTIKFENIFYSLLSAIVVFFVAGGVFYILGSEYNAIIQVAIYGIAVPVILGLAVMFTNLGNDKSEGKSNTRAKTKLNYVSIVSAGIFVLGLIYLVLASKLMVPFDFNLVENFSESSIQTILAIAKGLFVNYVWAFELVSIILTIIVVGLALTRKEDEC